MNRLDHHHKFNSELSNHVEVIKHVLKQKYGKGVLSNDLRISVIPSFGGLHGSNPHFALEPALMSFSSPIRQLQQQELVIDVYLVNVHPLKFVQITKTRTKVRALLLNPYLRV
jgi:hypothetical protein